MPQGAISSLASESGLGGATPFIVPVPVALPTIELAEERLELGLALGCQLGIRHALDSPFQPLEHVQTCARITRLAYADERLAGPDPDKVFRPLDAYFSKPRGKHRTHVRHVCQLAMIHHPAG